DINGGFGSDTTRIVGVGLDGSFTTGKTGIFRFADQYNQLGTTYGGSLIQLGYHGSVIRADPDLGAYVGAAALLVDSLTSYASGKPILIARGAPSQSVDIFQVQNSASTVLFNVGNTGNVGIGTTTPAQLLSVAGNMRLTGALFDTNNASGTLGMVLQTTGTTTQWVATSTLGISGGSLSGGTTGKLAVWSSPSTLTSGLLLDNGTVAGVNATSSSYTFNVQGSSAVNPLNISSSTGTSLLTVLANGNVGIGTSSPTAKLDIQGGDLKVKGSTAVTMTFDGTNISNGSGVYFSDTGGTVFRGPLLNDTTSAWYIRNQVNGGSLALQTTGAGVILLSPSQTTAVTVKSGGNVGIGTTTPQALLSLPLGTTAANGINFGDATANLFRSAAGTLTTNATFNAAIIQTAAVQLSNSGVINTLSGNALTINSGVSASIATFGVQINSVNARQFTSGIGQSLLVSSQGFTPTSGTGVYNILEIR
ncbi:MAG: hypothetical protein AAB729_03225, partial [Patescibacteria group bacterium]